MGAWYDKKTAVEVVNSRLWQQLKVEKNLSIKDNFEVYSIILVHFNLRREDNLSIMANFEIPSIMLVH